jgi:hypothetical protein
MPAIPSHVSPAPAADAGAEGRSKTEDKSNEEKRAHLKPPVKKS